MGKDDIYFAVSTVLALFGLLSVDWRKVFGKDTTVSRRSRSRIWSACVFGGIILSCVGWYQVRHRPKPIPAGLISSWGQVGPSAIGEVIKTGLLADEYAASYNIIAVARIQDDAIDYKSDPLIAKSNLFSIDGQDRPISIDVQDLYNTAHGPDMGTFVVAAQIFTAVLPKRIAAKNISTLADIEAVGGTILTETGVKVPLTRKQVMKPSGRVP